MPEKKASPDRNRHHDSNEPHHVSRKGQSRTASPAESGDARSKSKNVRDSENYKMLSMYNRLVINLRDLGHMVRFLIEGKGSQKRILTLLYKTGTITQRELTEKLGVQPGSASEVIGKLESAGLILRTPALTDRRTTDIQLTESGRAQAEEVLDQRKLLYQEMFSCFSAEEQETFLELLERLYTDWASRYKGDKGAL